MPGLRIREDGVKQPRRIATQQEVDEILLRRIDVVKRFRRTPIPSAAPGARGSAAAGAAFGCVGLGRSRYSYGYRDA